MSNEAKNKHIHDMIDSFLETHSTSVGGGWAPVGDTDIKTLNSIFHHIINSKYGKDADGDRPVEVEFVDRTKFERQYFLPMPYAKRDGFDLSVCLQRLQRTGSNLETASTAHQRELRMFSDFERDKLKTGSAFNYDSYSYEQMLEGEREQFVADVQKSFIAFIRDQKTNEELIQVAESHSACEKLSAFINKNFSYQFKSPISVSFGKNFSSKSNASPYRFTIVFQGLNNQKNTLVLQKDLW